MENKLFRKFWLLWEVRLNSSYDPYADRYLAKPLCPKNGCRCEIISNNDYWAREVRKYKCKCINTECGFELEIDDDLKEKWNQLITILQWKDYGDFEVIDLDGELIPINERMKIIDGDYWVDARISENKKWQKQLMVLAWSKKNKDKTQLFLDSSNERLWFDQNDTHPREVFAEVHAIFKSSQSKLSGKGK